MAERTWTPEQERAIKLRRGDLIVSAAAGSGKTSVLCERVIQSLLDENDPVDISEMLIVTFTEASAEEMRVRIGDAIREKMAKDPSNVLLFRQLVALQSADIGTIHSFCKKVVSANTASLGLASEVRVVDADENSITSHDIMQEVIDRRYRIDPDFSVFVNNFVTVSDDRLAETLLGIYKKTQSIERGIGIIDDLCREYSEMTTDSWNESRFARLLVEAFVIKAENYISEMQEGIKYIDSHENPAVPAARSDAYVYDVTIMSDFVSRSRKVGFSRDIKDAEVLAYKAKKCGTLRGIDDPKLEEIKDLRDKVKDFIGEIKNLLTVDFSLFVPETVSVLRSLYSLLSEFEGEFSREKKDMSVVDFTDLERMSYTLLVSPDGSPTALAREISKKYKQIYIDEYQDTNALQDAIFRAISNENRFMVGDIKQSIYSFRGAEPSIFAKYRDAFAKCPEDIDSIKGGEHSIFLANNFRCDYPIVEFSNLIFGTLFTNNSLKIKYLKEDDLKFSKQKEEERVPENEEKVSIILCKKDDNCAVYCEALTIAEKIKELASNNIPLSSIAVIMRSAKDALPAFKKIFEKEGIPVDGKAEKSLLDVPEVIFLISLLNAVNNPHRDIYFASLLSAGAFGINFNETVALASEKEIKGRSLYEKFREYTEKNDFEKGKKLISWLEKARTEASGKKIYEIIEDLCSDFALYALAAANKEETNGARKYLEAFKTLARNYEKNSYRGLYSFLRYIEDIKSGKASEDGLKVDGDSRENCVKLLTIHQSKGLEFEYCFVARCGKGINLKDAHSRFLLSPEFGAGLCVTDNTKLVKFSNLLHRSISEHIVSEQIDEEMRILYVALTRARKKLFVTAEVKDVETTLEKAEKSRKNISRYIFRSSTEYISWILASLTDSFPNAEILVSKASAYEDWKKGSGRVSVTFVGADAQPSEGIACDLTDVRTEESELPAIPCIDIDKIKSRLEYSYPYEKELSLPAKMAVSRLFPDLLDTDSIDLVRTEPKFTDLPKFVLGQDDTIPTGAMRGTATHVFMQFCDFENAEKNGVEIELARLCDKGFIDKALADLVYIDRLRAFFSSPLYDEIKNAQNVWREKRFSIMLPASHFTNDPERKDALSESKLLVQGVFDCLFEKADGTLKLIDYKTDSVSGDPKTDEAMFVERYTTQLSYYKIACERMMKKDISEISVYSFALGREVAIPV